MLRLVRGESGAEPERSCSLGQCDGSGWILDEEGEAHSCECRQRRASQAVSRRTGSGIPRRFQGVAFDRKPVCDLDPFVLRHVRAYTDRVDEAIGDGRGLWFYGDVGTGKTSLAMLVSKQALEAGRSVAIYSVPRLLAEIKQTFDREHSGSYMELFGRLCSVDLLHLDDLGAERTTDWVLEQLYSIINERWQDRRSIVVTTNLQSLDELRDQLGARTVSRLTEICGDPIPIMGPDLRNRLPD